MAPIPSVSVDEVANLLARGVNTFAAAANGQAAAPPAAGGGGGGGGAPPDPEKARQGEYRTNVMTFYYYALATIFGIFVLRHFLHLITYSLRPGSISPSTTSTGSPSTDYSYKPRRVPLFLSALEAGLTKAVKRPVWWFLGWNGAQLFGALFLVGWNVASLFIDSFPTHYQDTAKSNRLKYISYRAGCIAISNMLLAFVLVGRNNAVTFFTGIPYENLRFFHKAVGTTTFFFGAFHGVTYLVQDSIYGGGASAVAEALKDETVYTGVVALVGLTMLAAFGLPIVRKWFYELFLITHVLGYLMFIIGVYYHRPERRPWVYACIFFVSFERVARLVRKAWSAGLTSPIMNARAEIVSGAILLRVPYAGNWSDSQHAYLKFWDTGFVKKPWLFAQSHPFSVANMPYTGASAAAAANASGELSRKGSEKSFVSGNGSNVEKLYYSSQDANAFQQYRQEMFFIIRIHQGMTKELMQLVKKKTKARQEWGTNLSVSLEGPYGHELQTGSFETVLLFAGGSGVTHTLSVLLSLVQKARSNLLGHTLAVEFIWVVTDSSHISWISEYLNHAFSAPVPNLRVRCQVFVSRNVSTPPANIGAGLVPGVRDVMSVMKGRPDVHEIMKEATDISQGSILTVACGPKQLSETVQKSASDLSHPSSVFAGSRQRYIHCEVAKFE